MLKVKNRWNHKLYDYIEETDKQRVVLKRSDGSTLIIAKSDFDFNYFFVLTK